MFIGGIFSDKILLLNIFIILPLIFITQCQQNHPILKYKIKYIINNQNLFSNININPYKKCCNSLYNSEVDNLVDELKYDRKDIENAYAILKLYENKFILPNCIDYGKNIFCNSFRNPFDAQGLIVIGYIFNTYVYLYKHYKSLISLL